MKPKHTGHMPWDDTWDFRYYRVSQVRMIIKKVKIVEEKYAEPLRRSYEKCNGYTTTS